MNNGSLYNILGKDRQNLLKLNLVNATKKPLFQMNEKFKPIDKRAGNKLTTSNKKVIYKSPIKERTVPYITPTMKVKQLEQEIKTLKQVS
jgi:hypothetical protein